MNEMEVKKGDENLFGVGGWLTTVFGNQQNQQKIQNGGSMRNLKKIKSKNQTKLPTNTWISGLQLSLWDNISGPKVEHVWSREDDLEEEAQIYIARHTLCGEISQSEENLVEIKFHIFPELDFMVTAALFTAENDRSSSKYSFSLIANRKHLQKYLLLHPIVEDRLNQLVLKLRALLNKGANDAIETFSSLLKSLISNLESIYEAFLPRLEFNKTLFYDSMEDITISEFLAKAVTSHLQTHGCTVVIGEEIDAINKFIDTLSLFLINGNERKRSSHATSDSKYVPDLVLQGVLTSSIPDEEIIQSLLPTTLIDLKQQTVKQTHPFHEYNVLRRDFFNIALEKLLNNVKKKENLWTAQESFFRPIRAAAPCIEKIFFEVTSLPVSLREAYISQSMKLLIRKGVLLVRYVESLRDKQQINIEASALKKLRVDLDLSSEYDFSVLLGIAEKLYPGTYVALAGDPASIEEKFIELFESF